MKQLLNYKKNGYYFQLVKRKGDAAIFLGSNPKFDHNNYEVVKLQVTAAGSRPHPEDPNKTLEWEEHERPPGDYEWGTKGWTFPTIREAEIKFNQLTQPTNP